MAEQLEPVPDADAAVGKKTKGSPIFLIVVLVIVLLSTGGGAWLAYIHYPKLAAVAAALSSKEADGEEAPLEYGQFMELTGTIVNPAGTNGKRYLMVNLGLESQDAATLEEVTARDVVVRDTILKILSQRTVDQLSNMEERNALKEELRSAINGIVEKGEVNRLYFTQYVLQ